MRLETATQSPICRVGNDGPLLFGSMLRQSHRRMIPMPLSCCRSVETLMLVGVASFCYYPPPFKATAAQDHCRYSARSHP